MLRLTKQADYGIILATRLAMDPGRRYNAGELALDAGVPLPMTGKVLKQLARSGILDSQRGVKGGYRLARGAEAISVAEVIQALEGPIALTECIATAGECNQEPDCPTRGNWHRINAAIHGALAGISLAEMCQPLGPASIGHQTITLHA